jgi:hypothetical protein
MCHLYCFIQIFLSILTIRTWTSRVRSILRILSTQESEAFNLYSLLELSILSFAPLS